MGKGKKYIPENELVIGGGDSDESNVIGSEVGSKVVPLGRVGGIPPETEARRVAASDYTLRRMAEVLGHSRKKDWETKESPEEKSLKAIVVTRNPEAVVNEIEGTEVNINLPAVGSFKGFELKYFISKSDKYRNEIKSSLSENFFSTKDIAEMLVNMYDYMEAKGTPIKERILDKKRETLRRELTHEEKMEEYEEKLKNYNGRRNSEDWCMAGHLLKEKFGWKNKTFWVRDDKTNKIVILNMRSDDKFLFTDVGIIANVAFKM